MNSENKIYQVPEFTGEHIPVKEAARIMGKDSEYIRLGLIEGFLPIGSAYKRKGSSVYMYIPAKQHNSPEGTACHSASNCTKCS